MIQYLKSKTRAHHQHALTRTPLTRTQSNSLATKLNLLQLLTAHSHYALGSKHLRILYAFTTFAFARCLCEGISAALNLPPTCMQLHTRAQYRHSIIGL